jgi:hypothetical protein
MLYLCSAGLARKKRPNENTVDNNHNYNRGEISSSYIDDDGINKLKEVAYELNAKVVGDEGEEY